MLAEVLATDSPARVVELASQTGLAAGSISHHRKLLHRYGFIQPAPELARDTRESSWRYASRTLRWLSQDFEDGTVGRQVADCAAMAIFRHQVRAFQCRRPCSPGCDRPSTGDHRCRPGCVR